MKLSRAAVAAAVASLFADNAAVASCGSAFCFVDTNWAVQGIWNQPGPRLDFRYEYIDQDQPRAGSRRVGVGEIPRHHDEVSTQNQNVFATLDYGFSPEWGASLIVPYVDRKHHHIHNHQGAKIDERWDFGELGDVRVQGRWQTPIASSATDRAAFAGVTFGLKLPTGKFDVANSDGAIAERSLQPGSGTTDAMLGGYFRQVLPFAQSSWFVQAQGQWALNSRDDYKPGLQTGIDLGYRYEATDRLGLMVQLNFRYKGRDKGAQAEPEDSGGRFVTVAPGLSFAVTPAVNAYLFVQLPLYQYVNGVQLTADWSITAGASVQF